MLTQFGKKVKVALIQRGKTQKSLAQDLGVSLQHLNGVLHGKSALRLEEKVRDWLEQKETKKGKTMELTYYFGEHNEEEFTYEVDIDDVCDFIIKKKLMTKEELDTMLDESDGYERLEEEFGEDIQDHFEAEAMEAYEEYKAEQADPEGFRGVSRND